MVTGRVNTVIEGKEWWEVGWGRVTRKLVCNNKSSSSGCKLGPGGRKGAPEHHHTWATASSCQDTSPS